MKRINLVYILMIISNLCLGQRLLVNGFRHVVASQPVQNAEAEFILNYTVTSSLRNNYGGVVGFAIITSSSPVTVTQLGRYVAPGNTQVHTVRIADQYGITIASTDVATSGKTANQFAYNAITPVTLSANSKYFFTSEEVNGGDLWYDQSTVQYGSVATQLRSSYGSVGSYAEVNVDQAYVPVNFKYQADYPSTIVNASLMDWYVAKDFKNDGIPDRARPYSLTKWNSPAPTLSGNKLVFNNNNQANEYSSGFANWSGNFDVYWIANETFGWGFGTYQNGQSWGLAALGASYQTVLSNPVAYYDYSSTETGTALWRLTIDQTTSPGSTTIRSYKNSVLINQQTIANNTLHVLGGMNIMLGASQGAFAFNNGDFYEMLIYNNINTGSTTTTIENYLKSKYLSGSNGSQYDVDAQAFFASNIGLTTSQKTAVNNLILAYKSAGIWTKRKVIYPFIGNGTAQSSSWNLKDPTTYQIAFSSSGIAYTTNSIQFLRQNGYGDTHFIFSDVPALIANTSIGVYNATGEAMETYDYGVRKGNASSSRIVGHLRWSDGNTYFDNNGYATGRLFGAINAVSYMLDVRAGQFEHRVYSNGTEVLYSNSDNASYWDLPNYSFYLGNENDNGTPISTEIHPTAASGREFKFFVIGEALTPTEAAAEAQAVNAFVSAK